MTLLYFVKITDVRQMAFFVFAKVGKGGAKARFRVMLKYFEIKKLYLLISSLLRVTLLHKQIDRGPEPP